MHINAIGANFPNKRELDDEAVRRSHVIAADSRAQSKMEAGDLMRFFGEDDSRWSAVLELAEIVAGKAPGRTSPEQITLFRSNGIAIEDIVVAGHIYELARERGLGKQIAMWGEEVRASGARGV
jgi:ornithine cyclodeaminase/alanine dehydrogenase-like protein (mu-crystallin family)